MAIDVHCADYERCSEFGKVAAPRRKYRSLSHWNISTRMVSTIHIESDISLRCASERAHVGSAMVRMFALRVVKIRFLIAAC